MKKIIILALLGILAITVKESRTYASTIDVNKVIEDNTQDCFIPLTAYGTNKIEVSNQKYLWNKFKGTPVSYLNLMGLWYQESHFGLEKPYLNRKKLKLNNVSATELTDKIKKASIPASQMSIAWLYYKDNVDSMFEKIYGFKLTDIEWFAICNDNPEVVYINHYAVQNEDGTWNIDCWILNTIDIAFGINSCNWKKNENLLDQATAVKASARIFNASLIDCNYDIETAVMSYRCGMNMAKKYIAIRREEADKSTLDAGWRKTLDKYYDSYFNYSTYTETWRKRTTTHYYYGSIIIMQHIFTTNLYFYRTYLNEQCKDMQSEEEIVKFISQHPADHWDALYYIKNAAKQANVLIEDEIHFHQETK